VRASAHMAVNAPPAKSAAGLPFVSTAIGAAAVWRAAGVPSATMAACATTAETASAPARMAAYLGAAVIVALLRPLTSSSS